MVGGGLGVAPENVFGAHLGPKGWVILAWPMNAILIRICVGPKGCVGMECHLSAPGKLWAKGKNFVGKG